LAWTVQLAAGAEKTLSKLDPPIARRIVRKLEEVAADDPRRTGEAMQGDERAWRYRVGDWRVICDLVDETHTVNVVRIGHRSSVYGRN
jgi:mRNA interferase RelE/StbE